MKSFWALWAHPRRYFAAAADPEWQGKYTPSIRLWLSLVALISFLQFIWIGADTPMVAVYAQGFRDAGVILAQGLTYEALGEQAALWIYGLTPVFQAVGLIVLALIYPLWGQKTTFGLRLRFVFATVTPSATLMLFLLPSMRLLSLEVLSWFGFVIAGVAYMTDFITSFRGGFADTPPGGRLWRGALLAAAILLFNFVISILVQIGGIVLVSSRYGLTTG